jgi:hypothetical protein
MPCLCFLLCSRRLDCAVQRVVIVEDGVPIEQRVRTLLGRLFGGVRAISAYSTMGLRWVVLECQIAVSKSFPPVLQPLA